MPSRKSSLEKAVAQLRTYALSFPEAYEDFPWGDRVVKVRKKIFVFLGSVDATGDADFGIGVKLAPDSAEAALGLPFTQPMAYNLGKSGWIVARFKRGDEVPVGILKDWIDESYRAVAPKKLISLLP